MISSQFYHKNVYVYSQREVALYLTEIVLNYEWQTTRQIKESLGDIPCLSYK